MCQDDITDEEKDDIVKEQDSNPLEELLQGMKIPLWKAKTFSN